MCSSSVHSLVVRVDFKLADVGRRLHSVNVTERKPINPSLFLRAEELRRAADLLFYAHRDFSRVGLEDLAAHGLGLAQQRALQSISREEGLSVGALLDILLVTKQSLNRTLRTLKSAGMIREEQSRDDRRMKKLHLTDKGRSLVRQIEVKQNARIIEAYRSAGPKAIAAFWDILIHFLDPDQQEDIRERLSLDDIGKPPTS